MADIIIREATKNDIEIIQQLTYAIWPVTYGSILSADQLNYMLELIYSKTSLQNQMHEGHHFLIVEDDRTPVAFADYGLLKDDVYKLHKIYVLQNQQGKGIGKLLIDHVIKEIKEKNATALVLNVNRNNK